MKPRIKVFWYSQTGQMKKIIDSVLSQISDKIDVSYSEIKPVENILFPWKASVFFDTMPESVLEEAIDVKVENFNSEEPYDLVILGVQPWFLSPALPISGLLQQESFLKFLKNKKVITIVGSRNMWLNCLERVKIRLNNAKAHHVGNIVFEDRNPNLVSLITIIRWAMYGQKKMNGFPPAGVQENEIDSGKRFGNIIYNTIIENKYESLQEELLKENAVFLKPGLVLMEQNGIKNFRFWARFIQSKGKRGSPERKFRVQLFKYLLIVSIFILTPITALRAMIILQIKKSKFANDVEYFKRVKLEENRI